MKLLTTILFLSLISSQVQAEDTKKPSAKNDTVVVPFTLVSTGHFIVKVKLNDKGPYSLIFDTGAPTMLISNRIGKASGLLDKKSSISLFSPLGAMAPIKIKKFEIGELQAENIPAIVLDHPTVKLFSDHFEKDHGKIDGIVGFPFFAKYRMTVDYKAKELSFTPNGYVPGDIMESMMQLLMGNDPNKGKPKIVAAAGQWGLIVTKGLKDEEEGVDISLVMEQSSAQKAGLKKGDRLLTIDGRWTDSVGDTFKAASYAKPGQDIPIVIKRSGKEMKLQIKPDSGF